MNEVMEKAMAELRKEWEVVDKEISKEIARLDEEMASANADVKDELKTRKKDLQKTQKELKKKIDRNLENSGEEWKKFVNDVESSLDDISDDLEKKM
jgi:hypothetical protein